MRWPSSWKAAGLAAFVLLAFASTVNAVAVMSVDIGSEWMKVAVVSVSYPAGLPIVANCVSPDTLGGNRGFSQTQGAS